MATETDPRAENNLYALRIASTDRQPRRRNPVLWVGLVLVLALIIGGASMWLYQTTLGRPPEVQVAFARIVGTGAQAVGAVLSGAGYVVTGERYISIGRELHEQELIATQNLDVAENELAVVQATVHQAEAEVASAHVNLDYTKLTAPTDGIVLAKLSDFDDLSF